MITAITAMISVILGCAVVVMIQLALVAYHLDCLKSYTQTEISLLQQIASTDTPTQSPATGLSDEQAFHNTVVALNDLRRTNKENPRYTSCKSVAVAWINAAYERLR